VSTHCSALTEVWKSWPMCGNATFTTVASRLAIALAATVATSATRPFALWSASPSAGAGGALTIGSPYRRATPIRVDQDCGSE
jgi:hypothetical protein